MVCTRVLGPEAVETTATALVVRQQDEVCPTEIAFGKTLLGSEGSPPVLELEHEGHPKTLNI